MPRHVGTHFFYLLLIIRFHVFFLLDDFWKPRNCSHFYDCFSIVRNRFSSSYLKFSWNCCFVLWTMTIFYYFLFWLQDITGYKEDILSHIILYTKTSRIGQWVWHWSCYMGARPGSRLLLRFVLICVILILSYVFVIFIIPGF